MRTSLGFLPLCFVMQLSLSAQDGPLPPAAELARLKVFEGAWEGSGTASMMPGAPQSKWTSRSVYAWTLGGHFLQADTSIQFEGMPVEMRFREYMGWDRENKRHVNVVVSNQGTSSIVEMHFIGDNKLCTLMPQAENGLPRIERGQIKYTKDSLEMTLTFLGLEGPAADDVKGSFKRVAKAEVSDTATAKELMPPAAEMAKVARMVGTYDVAGEMVFAPGMAPTKIKGVDVVTSLFGGSVVQTRTDGSAEGMPGAYEGLAFYTYNPLKHRYVMTYVSNMGDIGEAEGWIKDDKFILTMAGLRMNEPMTGRSIMLLDANGRATSLISHSCIGASDPFVDFTATYKFRTK